MSTLSTELQHKPRSPSHWFWVILAGLALEVILSAGGLAATTAEIKIAAALSESAMVSGVVNVAGAYRTPKRLPVFKSRAFCGATVANETFLIDAQGGLRNAAVLLRPRDRKVTALPGRAELDNKNCAFAPHVQVVTAGSELLLKNSDPILHTVHARLGKETLFNVGLPRWRQITKSLDRPGVVRIDCDVLHTWMSAAIVVSDTPYFALTDQAGRFRIEGLPPGLYEMEVWHERLGSQLRPLALGDGIPRFIEVVYAAK